MNRYKSITILFVLILTAAVRAQHLPEELTFPRNQETQETADGETEHGGDSASSGPGAFFMATDQNYFDGSFTSSNNVYYAPDFNGIPLEQNLQHEMRRDRLGNTRQYFNAAGSLSYPLSGRAWITPGLDWTPVAQHSSERGVYNSLATLDMGPAALIDARGIPITLRAGVSGRRVDSLAAFMKVGDYRSNAGAYGAFRAGSEEETLPFAPVYFYADGLGRRIENSGMASLSGSALGAAQVGEHDSLFVYGAASLFNGREGYLEESADSRAAFFAETPWRIEHDAAFKIGYKIGRWGELAPSAYYSADQNVLEYPNDTRMRDETTLRQTISGALSTDSAAGVHYSGSIGFTWREHDKLFGQKSMPFAQTSGNADSLEINLWDYTAFDPRTAHRVAVRLPLSLRAIYDISVSRFLTEYPNSYVNGRDTVRNRDDNDRRTLQQRFALVYAKDTALRAELFAELSDYDLVFLRPAKSSSNRTDLGQRVGILFDWSPTNGLSFSEAVSAEAKRGEFHFPAFHQEALQRPRFSRAVNSSFSADWRITERCGLLGKWDIKFSDFGFWYGRDYMLDALAADPAARTDYYAITTKSVYTTIDAAVRFNAGPAELETGGALTTARDRNYSGGYYILTDEDGYSVKPYINAAVSIGDMTEMSAHVSRTFVTNNRDLSYWDFRLQAMAGF